MQTENGGWGGGGGMAEQPSFIFCDPFRKWKERLLVVR